MSDTISFMDNQEETASHLLSQKASTEFSYPEINVQEQDYALVPTRHCLLEQVKVNARSKRDLDAAIPFVLEERLAEPVEDLDFIYGEQIADGSRPVLICRKDKVTSWLDLLSDRNVIILPEVLALPFIEGCWTILIDNNRALVRTGLYSGYECNLEYLDDQLSLSLKLHTLPESIDYWLPEADNTVSIPDSIADRAKKQYYRGTFSDYLAEYAQPVENLGIHVSTNSRDSYSRSWKIWMPAVAITFVAFIFHVGSTIQSASMFNAEAEMLRQEAEVVFRETFPETKRIVNMRVQTEQSYQALAAQKLKPDSGFFELFSKSMLAISSIETMNVSNINWQQGTLLLQVSAASVADIELIQTRIEVNNYTVEMLNAVNNGDEYTAQLKIRAAG